MKKIGYTLGLLISLITFVACDNTTDDIGQTIIGGADIAIKTDTTLFLPARYLPARYCRATSLHTWEK